MWDLKTLGDHTLTVDFQGGEGLNLALLVGGSADVGAWVFMGDLRDCQDVGLLETLWWKLFLHLEEIETQDKDGDTRRSILVWLEQGSAIVNTPRAIRVDFLLKPLEK